MTNRSGLFWAVWVWVILVWGACSSSRQAVSDKETVLPNALLWEITSEDLENPSYLFGTIHIIPADLYFWTPQFQAAYEATDQVVMEIGELGMDPSAMMELMPRIMMPDNLSLEDLVSAEEYTRIETYFENMGMPMMFVNKIKPFFPYMLVEIDFANLMNADMKSYEQEITAMAKADQKTILGLETIDYQISLFDSIPYRDQAMLLVETIDNKTDDTGSEDPDSDLMFRTYVNQDLNGLYEQVSETGGPFEKYNDLFLDDRNRDWIPKIESIIRQHSSFIAVGAGHLPGKNGVIRLLQAQGYTLTPIMESSDGTD